jgi:two-component system, sensor histidine kinase RegB
MNALHIDLPRWFSALRRVMVAVLLGVLVLSEWWLALGVSFLYGLPAIAAMVVLEVLSSRPTARARLNGSEWSVWALAAADIVAVAVVIGASGGAANPFTAVLFVYVALAASLLTPIRTLLLAAFSAVTFGALFLLPSDPSCHAPTMSMTDHFYGMWVAYAVGALLVALFLARVRTALLAHQREIDRLRGEQADAAKFVALGTLAAGTAHELGTPLSTIAVLAEELSHEGAGERASTISREVERCRQVLNRMRPGARRDAVIGCRLDEAVARSVAAWERAHPDATVEIVASAEAVVPIESNDVEAALSVLMDNARDAALAGAARISVSIEASVTGPAVVVEDEGRGLDRSVVDRVGEPFVSTKGPGEGMGLGLFVVRSLLEQIGGKLVVEPRSPRGARVRLEFPGGTLVGAGAAR